MKQGPQAGFPLRYNPNSFNELFISFDEEFRESCCVRTDLCDIFYRLRPPNGCDSYDPPIISKGDLWLPVVYA